MLSKHNKILHIKDIKNISELNTTFVDNHKKPDFFSNFAEILNLGKYHQTVSSAYYVLTRIIHKF